MSSRLPAELLEGFDEDWRTPDGRVVCQGYRRRAHGRFGDGEFQRDHRLPEWRRPDLAFDRKNLQPLCIPCHRAKTAAEAGERAAWKRRAARRRVWWVTWVLVGLILTLLIALGWVLLELAGQPAAAAAWVEVARGYLYGYVLVVLGLYGVRWAWKYQEPAAGPEGPVQRSREEERILDVAEAVMGPKGRIRLDVTQRSEES